MNINLKLCPRVYRGASIKKKHSSLPHVEGFQVPILPLGGTIEIGDFWEVPIQGDCDIYDEFPVQQIRWAQRFDMQGISVLPFYKKVPRDQWIFKFTIPSGWFDLCPQCFGTHMKAHLMGALGFDAGEQFPDKNGEVSWEVHRDDLPFPGEPLVALTVVDGNGDMRIYSGPCIPSGICHVGGDCSWNRRVEMQTSGRFLGIAYGFFATPTWTGGEVVGYRTRKLGSVDLPEESQVCPVPEVYGDPSFSYSVEIEGEKEVVASTDFAGYGLGRRAALSIGSYVLTRKMGQEYEEPYDDSVLGSGGAKIIFPWHINWVGA